MQFPEFLKSGFFRAFTALTLALLFTMLPGRYFKNAPAANDAGTFEAVALSMDHGKVLYKDVFENKAPGVFFLDLPALKISDNPSGILRLFFIFITTFSIFLIFFKRWNDLIITIPFMFVFWHIFTDNGLFFSGNYTEFYGISFIIGSLVFYFSKTLKLHLLYGMATGILLSCAALLKEPFVVIVAPILLFGLFNRNKSKKYKLGMITGFLILPFFFLFYLLLNGAAHAYKEYLKFAFDYSASGNSPSNFHGFFSYMDEIFRKYPAMKFIYLMALLPVLGIKRDPYISRIHIVFIACGISSITFILLGEIIYKHYYIPFIFFGMVAAISGMIWIKNLIINLDFRFKINFIIPVLFIAILIVNFNKVIQESWRRFTVEHYHQFMSRDAEKALFQKKIPADKTIYIGNEALGRFYLYHPTFRYSRFPSPHWVYFGIDQPNATQVANRNILLKEFDLSPPDFFLSQQKFTAGISYSGCGNFINNHYQKSDSMTTCEGDLLYIYRLNSSNNPVKR